MKKLCAAAVGMIVLVAAGMSRADVLSNTQGNLTLTITSQGTPSNINGDTNGGGGVLATGWTSLLVTVTSNVPNDPVGGIDAGGHAGDNFTGFTGTYLQQWDLKRTGGAAPAGSVRYQNGTSPVGTDTNTNAGLSPSGGQFAVDSHWLITDPSFSGQLATSNVTNPNENGPALNATFTPGNPWSNSANGPADDVPTANNATGESWNTDSTLQGIFGINQGSQPQVLELAYLIVPTTAVENYDFQAVDHNNPNNLQTFQGSFSVPEPGSLTLLVGSGIACMATGRRKRRQAI